MDYIDIIIAIRKEKKITQREVANYLNIARSTYSDIENRKMKLNTDDFIKICNFFEISPSFASNEENKINITITKDEANKLKEIKKIIDKINDQVSYYSISNQNITIGNNNTNINFGVINKNEEK